MNPDITQSLKNTENTLRDFIATILQNQLGNDWEDKCGVSPDRIGHWRERKEVERKRQKGGAVEERLIYYADFYDLPIILKKHWNHFADALGDWKTMEIYLNELGTLRDPDAHRRELLPHQKQLAAGIAGEIRNRLIRYRSKLETNDDCFPRIECARDSLGHQIIPVGMRNTSITGSILRPGDIIEFVVTANDPMGEDLIYGFALSGRTPEKWQDSNEFQITITEAYIAKNWFIELCVMSKRDYHAQSYCDDKVSFGYTVLPAKK